MKYKRLLGYGAIGLTLIAIGVAFVKPFSTSNLLFRARAANLNNLSVTFSRATSTNSKGSYNNTDYVLTSKLQQSGLDVQASLTNGYAITSGSDVVRLNGASSTLLFSIPTNSSGVTYFRKITSISFVYNASYNVGENYFDVYFSSVSDFSVSEIISVESTASATPTISNAHYIKIIGDKSHYAYFNSITINYSCSDEPEVKILSSISVSGEQTEFTVGDTFSFGGTVTAYYSDSSSADVTDNVTFSGYDMDEEGEQIVIVSYTENEINKTTNYSITISAAPSGLSGTYAGAYTSIEFTSSTQGTYIYGSERLYFSYVVSGTQITFTYVSGDNTSFGSYRLFAGGSSPKVNTTGSIVSDSQITVKTYNLFDTATSRTFSK